MHYAPQSVKLKRKVFNQRIILYKRLIEYIWFYLHREFLSVMGHRRTDSILNRFLRFNNFCSR